MTARQALKKFDSEHSIHTADIIYRLYADIVWCEQNNIRYDVSYAQAMNIHRYLKNKAGLRIGYDHMCIDCRQALVRTWIKYML